MRRAGFMCFDKRAGNGRISCPRSQPDPIQRHTNCGDSTGRVLMSDDQMIGCDKTSHHHKLRPKSLCYSKNS